LYHPLSVAVALIVTVDPVAKLALLAGLVILTTGATLALLTTIAIVVEVVAAPKLSVAFAVKENFLQAHSPKRTIRTGEIFLLI